MNENSHDFVSQWCPPSDQSPACQLLRNEGSELDRLLEWSRTLSDPAPMQNDPPLSCITALVGQIVVGGFCAPLDPEALARAEAAFSAVAQFPPFPQAQLSAIIEEALDGIVLRLIIYFYGPILLISLLAIWLMVGAKWIGWVVGLILTLVVAVILYAFSVFLRISLSNFANSIVSQLETVSSQYRTGLVNAVPRLPQAILSAICGFVNQTWVCPPTTSGNQDEENQDETQDEETRDENQEQSIGKEDIHQGFYKAQIRGPQVDRRNRNLRAPRRGGCCGGK